MMDTHCSQAAQNVNYHVLADNLDTAMMYELSTQLTETTQRDLCMEDYIGCYKTASHPNQPHTGPFTQPQYGGDSSGSHVSGTTYPTVDNLYPVENIPNNHVWGNTGTSHENSSRTENLPQDHAQHESTCPFCAIFENQPSQISSNLFELLSSYTSSTPLHPAASLPQQPANAGTSHSPMMLSQDGNYQPGSKLRRDDTASFYEFATHDEGTARGLQLVGPKDRAPVVKFLANGSYIVSWGKF